MQEWFDSSLVRFGTSGTLILCYSLADMAARRLRRAPADDAAASPKLLKGTIFTSITAFYLLIGPTGSALFAGLGNLAGIALALVACAIRVATRDGVASVRHPDVAARMLFYAALPLAVGVPWGWLALTAPAVALSAWWTVRTDERLARGRGRDYAEWIARSHRWVPGLW